MYDEQRNTVWRFAIIFIAIFIGFAAVLGRIIYIQAFEREAWLKVAEQQVPTHRPIAATRGNILDCNGRLLASSMPQYYMYMDKSWDDFEKNGYGNKWVRGLYIENDINAPVPRDKQDNITLDTRWIKGSEKDSANLSSCAYYFADSLQKTLGMPVGVLCAAVGGSRLDTWLSRETVENDQNAKDIITRCGSYIEYNEWESKSSSFPGTFTSNFNARIYPLRNFKISGMLWYQGEADICSKKYGEYTYLLDLLQEQNTKNFQYGKKKLPIVYSTLASYDYGYADSNANIRNLQDFNFELANFQSQDIATRICVTNYDVPLSYYSNYTTIHPNDKQPIGDRMAFSAMGLVYGRKSFYGAATFKNSKIEGNSIYITFDNVGEGLKTKDGEPRGFAICGEDGIYYRADAEIVSNNTVRVYCDDISNPVSATYAFSYLNNRANLYSTCYGKYLMPVSPVVTNRDYKSCTYCDYAFADCESEEIWKMAYTQSRYPDDLTGYYKAWNTLGCHYSIEEKSAYKGSAGLNIASNATAFSITQNFQKKKSFGEMYYFTSLDSDFTKYGAMSFMIRNNGDKPITVYNKLFSLSKWYSASINGSGATEYIIPNDGKWYEIELNLTSVYEQNKGERINGQGVLGRIEKFEIIFESDENTSNIDIDEFIFRSTPKNTDNKNEKKSVFDMIIHFISVLFKIIRNHFISLL